MHERGRAERGFGDRTAIEEGAARSGIHIDSCREFHEQIVRVLAVDQLIRAVRGFARGEQIGIAFRSHQRFEAQHRSHLQPHTAEIARRRQHRHRRDERLFIPARSALVGIDTPRIAVQHQHPRAGCDVQPVHRTARAGVSRCAGAFTVRGGGRGYGHAGHLRHDMAGGIGRGCGHPRHLRYFPRFLPWRRPGPSSGGLFRRGRRFAMSRVRLDPGLRRGKSRGGSRGRMVRFGPWFHFWRGRHRHVHRHAGSHLHLSERGGGQERRHGTARDRKRSSHHEILNEREGDSGRSTPAGSHPNTRRGQGRAACRCPA